VAPARVPGHQLVEAQGMHVRADGHASLLIGGVDEAGPLRLRVQTGGARASEPRVAVRVSANYAKSSTPHGGDPVVAGPIGRRVA